MWKKFSSASMTSSAPDRVLIESRGSGSWGNRISLRMMVLGRVCDGDWFGFQSSSPFRTAQTMSSCLLSNPSLFCMP